LGCPVPEGELLKPTMARLFRRLKTHFLDQVPRIAEQISKKEIDADITNKLQSLFKIDKNNVSPEDDFVPLESWSDDIKNEVQPIIEIYGMQGAHY
jgi:uncharacterized protein with von Willebrand factor type A (vWA) domain